jgi:hypothetical protein
MALGFYSNPLVVMAALGHHFIFSAVCPRDQVSASSVLVCLQCLLLRREIARQ